MSHIEYNGPFIKSFYTASWNGTNTATRPAGHPFASVPFSDNVPVGKRRVYLLIQNKSASTELRIGFDKDPSIGGGMILYAGQSITLENYNGPVLFFTPPSQTTDVFITEGLS